MIEVTARMRHRPRDKRDYPIPFVQFMLANGEPDFRIIDQEKLTHCLRKRLCALCGEPMGRHIYFIGGDKCVQHGYFYDGPMHRDCAIFSMQICPHLAREKGRYSPNVEIDPALLPEGIKLSVGNMDITKSAHFLLHAEAYQFGVDQTNGNHMTIKAKLPWLDVTEYKNGFPILTERKMMETNR